MIDFSKMPCVYWSDIAKISYLQRRIIIYSIMYYEHNESCISDKEYDSMSYQLVELQKNLLYSQNQKRINNQNNATDSPKVKTQQKIASSTQYGYAMYDFDGTTGFDIPSRLTEKDRKYLTHLAYVIHKKWKEDTAKNERSKQC